MIDIKIKLDISRLNPSLRKAKLQPNVMVGIARASGRMVKSEVKRNILERASSTYLPWKNPKYKGNKLLYLNGSLYNSILKTNTVVGEEVVVSYGSDIIYAKRQYEGDMPFGSGILPRPYLDLVPDSFNLIGEFLGKQVSRKLNR